MGEEAEEVAVVGVGGVGEALLGARAAVLSRMTSLGIFSRF